MSEQSSQKMRRIQLHKLLEQILGSTNVYFEPPESIKMKYPCIVYGLDDIYSRKADNISYTTTKHYQVTCIGKDPDTILPDKILEEIKTSSYERRFKSDNLIHDVIALYF